MTAGLVIRNIGRLVTMELGRGGAGPLGVIERAALRARDGKIVWAGEEKALPPVSFHEKLLDACGGVILPGFVDCHTHLVHAGWRQGEFNLRSQGKSYQEIAAAGGGIMSTVRATRGASQEELVAGACHRAAEALAHGTTCLEVKTGYGLDAVSETKMVGAIGELSQGCPQEIVGTTLAAHIVPEEYRGRRADYLRLLLEEILPQAIASGVVSACDVFVEEGAFTADEARAIARAARGLGLALHLHVDQFHDVGGGSLAAELHALSADHLDHLSDEGIVAMRGEGVVAVVLPGASFFAGRGRYPDARRMIDRGLAVAIATDYNPGTNPSLDLLLAATIAVVQMGMSCDEALMAITKNAAAALGLLDRGSILPGKRADLVVLDAPDEHFPLYRYGASFVEKVVIGGEVAFEKTQFPLPSGERKQR